MHSYMDKVNAFCIQPAFLRRTRKAKTRSAGTSFSFATLCPEPDSNRQTRRRGLLRPLCLPFHHPGRMDAAIIADGDVQTKLLSSARICSWSSCAWVGRSRTIGFATGCWSWVSCSWGCCWLGFAAASNGHRGEEETNSDHLLHNNVLVTLLPVTCRGPACRCPTAGAIWIISYVNYSSCARAASNSRLA